MKRTRHQFAPAVPMQKIIDSAVAGGVPDGLFVGCLEIMDVQHVAGTVMEVVQVADRQRQFGPFGGFRAGMSGRSMDFG